MFKYKDPEGNIIEVEGEIINENGENIIEPYDTGVIVDTVNEIKRVVEELKLDNKNLNETVDKLKKAYTEKLFESPESIENKNSTGEVEKIDLEEIKKLY